MGAGCGQAVLLQFEPAVLLAVLDAGGADLLDLVAQEVDLPGPLAERGRVLGSRQCPAQHPLHGKLREPARKFIDVAVCGILDHRHDESVRGIGRKTDIDVSLQN